MKHFVLHPSVRCAVFESASFQCRINLKSMQTQDGTYPTAYVLMNLLKYIALYESSLRELTFVGFQLSMPFLMSLDIAIG